MVKPAWLIRLKHPEFGEDMFLLDRGTWAINQLARLKGAPLRIFEDRGQADKFIIELLLSDEYAMGGEVDVFEVGFDKTKV